MVNTPTLSFFHFENYLFQQIDERVSMANKIQRVVRAHHEKVEKPTLSEKLVKKVQKATLTKESYAALKVASKKALSIKQQTYQKQVRLVVGGR